MQEVTIPLSDFQLGADLEVSCTLITQLNSVKCTELEDSIKPHS